MKNVFLLLLFYQVASPVKHSMTTFLTGSTGVPNFPEFVGVVMVDGVEVVYCDSNIKRAEPKQEWMTKVISDDPKHTDRYTDECNASQRFFSSTIQNLMQSFNQTGGVHIFQRMFGCEWDDETGEVNGFNQYGYDGEDFMAFDLKTQTWIAPVRQAVITKHKWDNDKVRTENITYLLTQLCPEWLRKYVDHGRSYLPRTDLPSVSLLQKTPSSPVSCHATGFYPDRAVMFWRKDGEELHEDAYDYSYDYVYEDVDNREILPNQDGTFQMSVELKLSSDTPEDWRRYDCVFQLSGVKDDIVTRLDKAVIRANWEEHSLKFFFTGSTGIPNIPEFMGVVMVDGVEVVYCDSNIQRAEPKQEWMKKLMEDDPKHMDWYTNECHVSQRFFNSTIESLMQPFSPTGGVHTLQRIYGCEWEKEAYAFDKYGYDGEDFLRFDLTWKAWFPSTHPQAFNTKLVWDRDSAQIKNIEFHLTQRCPHWLRKYLDNGNNTLWRTEPPSVSLLQRTPSSPVSCHATGFYPDRAVMFWRKDGEELHEDVDHGEILPNHDGTFQMSVELNISSVTPEDWRRYDCVFQLSSVKDDIVTQLDKAVIRTNWEEHSLKFFFTGSTGVPNIPEFIGVVMVDGVEVVYCDSNTKRAEPKQEWMKKLMEDDPKHMDWYTDECHVSQRFFNSTIESLMQPFSPTGGVHTLQRIYGCELDKHTFDKYGYDGEDFMKFDLTWKTWFPSAHPQAFNTKLVWDRDSAQIKNIEFHLTQRCPDWLKKYLDNGNNTLWRTDLPSVSLLQKTPSSPVSCHATGFYPDRVVMFWRKDGEVLHEDVDHGEILPNHDGTFQMSVELKLSSVTPEDWKRYDCVFQLSGVNDDIVTQLDKAVIRTNWGSPSGFSAGPLIGTVVGLLLLLSVYIAGLFMWRRNNNGAQ